MILEARTIVRVLKRLKAAVGYQELGMRTQALACLDDMLRLGDPGDFRRAERIIRADVLLSNGNTRLAAKALEIAACSAPAPENMALWLVLATCYLSPQGSNRSANEKAAGRGAKAPQVEEEAAGPE